MKKKKNSIKWFKMSQFVTKLLKTTKISKLVIAKMTKFVRN